MIKELEKEVLDYLNTQTLPKIDSLVYRVIKNLIFGFAEPKEKQIERLTKEIDDFENMKATLESKIADLEETIVNFKKQVQSQVEATIELDKENAEPKEQSDKWFVFETEAGNWGMDKATQYTVDRHNYFYGTKNECQKWAVEHKIKDYTGHKYCYDRLDNQLTKAKEIIKELVENFSTDYRAKGKAEQFLNSENIILEDAQAGNSPFDADEVFHKEMKAYPEEK